jgi:hypothetical protein
MGPIRFQWMEYQVRKRQAAATRENFTQEIVRTSARCQMRTPATSAKMLKKTARRENQFMSEH